MKFSYIILLSCLILGILIVVTVDAKEPKFKTFSFPPKSIKSQVEDACLILVKKMTGKFAKSELETMIESKLRKDCLFSIRMYQADEYAKAKSHVDNLIKAKEEALIQKQKAKETAIYMTHLASRVKSSVLNDFITLRY
jgi:hypothetical protein